MTPSVDTQIHQWTLENRPFRIAARDVDAGRGTGPSCPARPPSCRCYHCSAPVVAGRRRPHLALPTINQPVTEGSLTKAALVEQVADATGLTKKRTAIIVDTVFGNIAEALQHGEKVELRGFGSFRLRSRESRRGRNPRTGDRVDVPPRRVPFFKPGKELKELINREPAQAVPPRFSE